MRRNIIIFCLLVVSFASVNAQSVEEGLVRNKWRFNRIVCDMKVGDTTRNFRFCEANLKSSSQRFLIALRFTLKP